jgi:glycosyltransferase involved in cell wall biosynthesis
MDATVLRMAKRVTRVPRIRRAARGFDLLHIPVPIPLYQAMDAPCCVATIYDLSTHLYPETHEPINISTWDGFFGWARQRCSRVIAISEHTKQDIITHIGIPADRVVVTPLACRQATRRIESAEECEGLLRSIGGNFGTADGVALPPFVLYGGTLEPRKNLAVLLRAFATLIHQEKGLPHRVVLAGASRGQEDVELRRLAEDLLIGDRLVITGYVTAEQMNALMSACDAFAYVSRYEGFGLPPLEAMTCGAPVIVSNASSLPEVVGNAGLLVAPEDVEGIAAALFALLTNSKENERRRRMSLARAREFNWERTARLTLAAYEEALDGRSLS